MCFCRVLTGCSFHWSYDTAFRYTRQEPALSSVLPTIPQLQGRKDGTARCDPSGARFLRTADDCRPYRASINETGIEFRMAEACGYHQATIRRRRTNMRTEDP